MSTGKITIFSSCHCFVRKKNLIIEEKKKLTTRSNKKVIHSLGPCVNAVNMKNLLSFSYSRWRWLKADLLLLNCSKLTFLEYKVSLNVLESTSSWMVWKSDSWSNTSTVKIRRKSVRGEALAGTGKGRLVPSQRDWPPQRWEATIGKTKPNLQHSPQKEKKKQWRGCSQGHKGAGAAVPRAASSAAIFCLFAATALPLPESWARSSSRCCPCLTHTSQHPPKPNRDR